MPSKPVGKRFLSNNSSCPRIGFCKGYWRPATTRLFGQVSSARSNVSWHTLPQPTFQQGNLLLANPPVVLTDSELVRLLPVTQLNLEKCRTEREFRDQRTSRRLIRGIGQISLLAAARRSSSA